MSRSSILRNHLEKQHTLNCNCEHERRNTTREITFVTKPTPDSRTCFGCCFCKSFYDDQAALKKHIEDDHVTKTVLDNHNRRTYSYGISNVDASTEITDTAAKWIINDLPVSDLLHSFRDQVVARQYKCQPLSDTDLLALDYIFPFGYDVNQSAPIFTDAQHKIILEDVAWLQYPVAANQFALKWCGDLAEMGSQSWREVKLTTAKCIGAAATTGNDDDLLAAEIIHALSGRLINKNNGKRMLEDSFAHRYLDPILETVFGSDERLRQDWANGTLLPAAKRRRNNNDNAKDEDNDEDDTDTIYKPDWVVFANGASMLTVVGTLELKVNYKRNPGFVSDYVKLAKEMKLVLHQLIHLGVTRPVASGILIQGTPES
ncbi:hypothetical protein BCR43DRAFT_516668 [Syncephalastrum racemosum]|uniref:C2H2-type domain-containing protein n=1 Tax=Syncephalastrum racemosum TaxID=13706 RepID=A0A1X2H946_SYNRA|nr:hypothetical protein BCR43DRAFT_516668 [Syncephalastrum racemosum]